MQTACVQIKARRDALKFSTIINGVTQHIVFKGILAQAILANFMGSVKFLRNIGAVIGNNLSTSPCYTYCGSMTLGQFATTKRILGKSHKWAQSAYTGSKGSKWYYLYLPKASASDPFNAWLLNASCVEVEGLDEAIDRTLNHVDELFGNHQTPDPWEA